MMERRGLVASVPSQPFAFGPRNLFAGRRDRRFECSFSALLRRSRPPLLFRCLTAPDLRGQVDVTLVDRVRLGRLRPLPGTSVLVRGLETALSREDPSESLLLDALPK